MGRFLARNEAARIQLVVTSCIDQISIFVISSTVFRELDVLVHSLVQTAVLTCNKVTFSSLIYFCC
jgi:hypothetical protein